MNENTIKALISTLNQIDIHGKENLDKLLGCIMVLEQMLVETSKKEVNTDG